MTTDEFAELVRERREAWERRVHPKGIENAQLPKPKPPEPLPAGQGELW